MRKPRTVPEVAIRSKRQRAGFVPGYYEDEGTVEIWQIWMHHSDGDASKERRATTADMRAAGYARKRRQRGR